MLPPTTINIIFIFLLVDLSNLMYIIDKMQFSVYWQFQRELALWNLGFAVNKKSSCPQCELIWHCYCWSQNTSPYLSSEDTKEIQVDAAK
jgi:hypothetical protein